MNIDVSRRLTHTATLYTRDGFTASAEPAYATAGISLACFIEPLARLTPQNTGALTPYDFDVYVLGTQPIGPGDRLVAGTVPGLGVIIPTGSILSIDDSMHPLDERKLRICHVKNTVAL